MRIHPIQIFILWALASPAILAAAEDAKAPSPAPQTAENTAKPAKSCKAQFNACLEGCVGRSAQSCVMGCEADCSVCTFEDTKSLNSAICQAK